MAGHRPPEARRPPTAWINNTAPTEEEQLELVKQAYVDGLIDVDKMEEDIKFILEGGYFAGSYARQFEIRARR